MFIYNPFTDGVVMLQKMSITNHRMIISETSVVGDSPISLYSNHESACPFKCDECDRTFISKRRLEIHTGIVYEKDTKHECHICLKSFGIKSSLAIHYIKHTGNVHSYPQSVPKNYL